MILFDWWFKPISLLFKFIAVKITRRKIIESKQDKVDTSDMSDITKE